MNVIEILKDPKTRSEFEKLAPQDQVAFAWRAQWLSKAHKHQILPAGDWWSIWLMLAGRGAGKTRTAAEQIGWWAWSYPNTRWLVAAPTSSDVRATCFEGDSGLLSVVPPQLVADYNKALHELKLTNGSLIKGIPASEPERFRGPQFHGGWCCLPGTSILMADGSEKAVEAIKCGEAVMTRHGPRKVLAAGMSGNPSGLVTITTGQTSLTVTEDHPILVGSQWIPAGDIKEGDLVWTASFTTASHGTKGPAATITTSAADTYTDISGRRQTGRSHQSSLSITPITTSRTTTLRTLFSCLRRITSGITRLAGQCQSSGSRWLKRSLLLQEFLSQRCASFVQRALSLTRWGRPLSSVPCLAWSGGGVTHSSLSSEPVLFAKEATSPSSRFSGIAPSGAMLDRQPVPIELTQQAVKSVARFPNSTTYNLTVEGEHEFIANGIVVHNCDELAAWDYLQEAWDQMQFGLRLKLPNMPTRLICTTTPKPKDLIVDLVSREGDDVALTTASTYSNLDNLSDSFRKQILQYEGTKLGRQEIYAEIIDPEDGGIVRRDWFRLWPAGKEFPKFEYIVQSYDCATSEKTINDPTAAETWGVFKPLDGPMSVMLIDCWQDRLQYPELREKVQEEYEVIFGEGKDKKRVDTILVEDKSAGISLIQDLRRAHLPVAAYNPGKADKIQRLNIVSHIIARGRVWIPESDKRKGYVKDWAEPLVSQICSFPDSTHDDMVDACVDALTQIQMVDGTKAIKDVVVGELVMTPAGPRRVLAVHNNGVKEVWEVNGLLATGDHRVMTQFGWERVDNLNQTIHNVYLYQGDALWCSSLKTLLLKQLSSMAASIGDTLKARTRRIGGILEERAIGFIGMFGNSIMGRFQRECTSTISMETRQITTSQTLPVYHSKIIGMSTERSYLSEPSILNKSLTWNESERKQVNGIGLKQEERGTESTLKRLWQKLGAPQKFINKLRSIAFGAEQKACEKSREKSFAPQPVKTPNLSSVSVRHVTNTRTMRLVYDLTIEGEHCYFANGMLVHNCTQALRWLRDAGWLEVDPPPRDDWDEDDYVDTGRTRENPYAV